MKQREERLKGKVLVDGQGWKNGSKTRRLEDTEPHGSTWALAGTMTGSQDKVPKKLVPRGHLA